MLTKSCKKVANIFNCEYCDYNTSRKSSYDKHVLTAKHIKLTDVNKKLQKSCKKVANISFTCQNCNKVYKSRVGLWKHNKYCIIEEEKTPFELTGETIITILKQNSEFQQMLVEQNKTIMELSKNGNSITSITNNTTTNSNNKSFNLSVFLNETCKDAMNITDFVDSIKLQLSDLINVGEMGYIEGISSIIVKNLNALDVTLRPVHCTDKKRETMYIKDQDKWEREDGNKSALHKMVRKVANKNISLIQDYKARYPDCTKSSSRFSNQYNKIVIESMGCSGETSEFEKEEKIIKRVAKEVILDKVL